MAVVRWEFKDVRGCFPSRFPGRRPHTPLAAIRSLAVLGRLAMSGRTPKRARFSVKLSGGTSCSPAQVELWRKGTLCDVTVTAGEVAFPAHKLVLAAGSSTLRGLLTSEMCDSEQPSLPSVPCGSWPSCRSYFSLDLLLHACSLDFGLGAAVLGHVLLAEVTTHA